MNHSFRFTENSNKQFINQLCNAPQKIISNTILSFTNFLRYEILPHAFVHKLNVN